MRTKFILKLLKIYLLSMTMIVNSIVFAAQSNGEDAQLKAAISLTNTTLSSINSAKPSLAEYCADCNAMNPRIECSRETFDALDDIYTNGTVGMLNSVFGGGEFKDPRTTCNSSLVKDYKPDYKLLTKDIEAKYPTMITLNDFSSGCFEDRSIKEFIESGRERSDLELAKAYVAMDFHVKNQKIADENIRLFEAKNQLANLIDVKGNDCGLVKDRAAKARCEELKKCNNKKKDELVQNKVDDLVTAIESLKVLKQEKSKLHNNKISLRNKPEKIKELNQRISVIDQNIEIIKQANPALLSDDFKAINSKLDNFKDIDTASIKSSYLKTLKTSAAKIDERISKLNKAQNCVLGTESDCSKSTKLLASLPNKDAQKLFIEKDASGKVIKHDQLNYMNNFYSCVENTIESRNKADDVLDEVAITLAITIATFGAGAVIAGGANLLKFAAVASKAKNITTLATTAADLGYASKVGADNYSVCSEIENELKNYDPVKNKVSCEDTTINMYKSSNMNRCYASAALSAAGIAVGGGLALTFLKVPKAAASAATTSAKTATSSSTALAKTGTSQAGKKAGQVETVIEEATKKLPNNKAGLPQTRPTFVGAADDTVREVKDAAGNLWQYSQKNKTMYINGEKTTIVESGGKRIFVTDSGKSFEMPLNTVDAPIALNAPKSTALSTKVAAREVAEVTPTPKPHPIKDVVPPKDEPSLSLTTKTDVAVPTVRPPRTHIPVTAGAASAGAILTTAPLTSGGPSESVDAPTPTPTPISAEPEIPNEPEKPTESALAPPAPVEPEVLSDLKDLLKFNIKNDDCFVKITPNLKEAKEKYADLSCKFTRCKPSEYDEDKDKCKNFKIDNKGEEIDREEKGYYIYPVCKTSKGADAKYKHIEIEKDKYKRILINAAEELVSCKETKPEQMPNIVIPDAAPNVGKPNLMQAPSMPVLIEY